MKTKSKKDRTDQFREAVRQLVDQLHDISSRKKLSVNDVHDLRVAIKRLRVFFAITILTGERVSSLNLMKKSLRTLFRRAGKLRSMQLIFEKLKEQSVGIKQEAINKKIKKDEVRLKSAIRKFNLKRFRVEIKDLLKRFEKKSGRKNWHRLPEKIQSASWKLIRRNIEFVDSEQIHSVRKEVRKILDLYFFLPQILSKQLQADLKNIHSVLGKWHDQADYSAFILKRMKQSGNKKEKVKRINLFHSSRKREKLLIENALAQLRHILRNV